MKTARSVTLAQTAVALALFNLGCSPKLKLPAASIANGARTVEAKFDAKQQHLLDYTASTSERLKREQEGWVVDLLYGQVGNMKKSWFQNVEVRKGTAVVARAKCHFTQEEGSGEKRARFRQHALDCQGDGFKLSLEEPKKRVVRGTAQLGEVALTFESTQRLTGGSVSNWPAGFNFKRDGNWVASAEYFANGKMYFPEDLDAVSKNAAIVAILTMASGGAWFSETEHRLEDIPR